MHAFAPAVITCTLSFDLIAVFAEEPRAQHLFREMLFLCVNIFILFTNTVTARHGRVSQFTLDF
jgi:hypothetical protein